MTEILRIVQNPHLFVGEISSRYGWSSGMEATNVLALMERSFNENLR
jgi:hypothetical protein